MHANYFISFIVNCSCLVRFETMNGVSFTEIKRSFRTQPRRGVGVAGETRKNNVEFIIYELES